MFFTFKNKSLFYETFGKGPAVVLLHGFLESSIMWKPLILQLAKTHTVVTVDFPGHGKSEVIGEKHTMELMAEAVNSIVKHLNIPTATFVGHSMGGYVVLAYAKLFYDEIDKIILLNSTPAPDSEERKVNRNRALKVIDKNPKAFISMAISNLFAEDSTEEFTTEIEALKNEAYSFPVEGIKAAIKGMRDRKDRSETLKDFKKEKYMVLGETDPLLHISKTEKLARDCGASIEIIEGGHMSLIENLGFFNNFMHLIG